MDKDTLTCIAAANRIISRTNAQNRWREEIGKPQVKFTGKRLQKILYLCELFWYIDHKECHMITEDFYAWAAGPTIPEIYNYWLICDCYLLPRRNTNYILSEEERYIINAIVDNTIDLSTGEIISFTQLPNGPWEQAYKGYRDGFNDIISKNIMKEYMSNEENQRELIDFIKRKNNSTLSKKMLPPKNSEHK